MFGVATSHLAEQLAGEKLIPSSSLLSSADTKLLSIVERDRQGKYTVTRYTLPDILTERASDIQDRVAVERKEIGAHECTSTIKVTSKAQGDMKQLMNLNLTNVKNVNWKVDFGTCSLEQVDLNLFTEQVVDRRVNLRHRTVQDCKDKDVWYKFGKPALGVVTGLVRCVDESELIVVTEPKLEVVGGSHANKTGRADVEFTSEQKVKHGTKIPAGTVTAYQVVELLINGNDGTIVSVSNRGGIVKGSKVSAMGAITEGQPIASAGSQSDGYNDASAVLAPFLYPAVVRGREEDDGRRSNRNTVEMYWA